MTNDQSTILSKKGSFFILGLNKSAEQIEMKNFKTKITLFRIELNNSKDSFR